MIIDLNSIKDSLILNESIVIPEEYYVNTPINTIEEVNFEGIIRIDGMYNILIDLNVNGIMHLSDSITLDDIEYPFNIEISEVIDENSEFVPDYYKKEQNTLDLISILWQNIVLEVPIRITNGYNDSTITKGNGWKIVNDDNKEMDPRLAPLKELLDKREE